MRSPTTTGDECPGGNSIFHTAGTSGPIASGSADPSATPAAFGPRNCGQSAAARGRVEEKTNRAAIQRGFIEMISEGGRLRRGGYCTERMEICREWQRRFVGREVLPMIRRGSVVACAGPADA